MRPMQQRRIRGYADIVPEDEAGFEDGQQCVVRRVAATARARESPRAAGTTRRARVQPLRPTEAGPNSCARCVRARARGQVEATALTGVPYRDALLGVSRADADARRLGGEALAAWLPPPPLPILLSHGGNDDPVEPSWELRGRGDVRKIEYPFSGHLPFLDKASREEYLLDLLEFLDGVDGVRTPRRGLSDGR
eukprot:5477289-Prymnesium_polylepis.1